MITISVSAADRGLLTAAQLRAAAGLTATDTSRDTELAAIGLTVADIICETGCGVAGDGITPVTLRQETLVETFYPEARGSSLKLSRRFLGTVTVVEDGATLIDGTDYVAEKGIGNLIRLSSSERRSWSTSTIVVTYQAGFATVPTPLADVAAEMVGRRAGAERDPLMRSERVEVPGVRTVDRAYWVDAAVAVDITPDMAQKLSRYRSGLVW